MSASDPPRILLVDDSRENLFAMREVLRCCGAAVDEAQGGADALERVLERDYALVLLDVHMPEMDGYEVARLMRGRPRSRGIPIVFVTAAVTDAAAINRGYGAGAVDFLLKPVDPDVLRWKVEGFLELYRHRAELAERVAERDRLVAELRATIRLNETFAAVLGHDLRSPLSAILNTGQLLALAPDDAARVRQAAARIVDSGQRMSRMIEQLLDFARARLGEGFRIQPVDVDVGELGHRVVGEARARAGEEGTVDLIASGDLRAQVDPDRVAQVLSNLVGNALQHGADGSVTISLDGGDPAWIRIAVTNRGEIPADLAEHLFDPFRSGTHARRGRAGGGLGLGLYIVQQIVRAHGGGIEVRSSPQAGTTFTVVLPRLARDAPASADRQGWSGSEDGASERSA